MVKSMPIFKHYNESAEEEVAGDVVSTQTGENPPKQNNVDVLAGISDKEKERLKQELLDEMLNGKKGDK